MGQDSDEGVEGGDGSGDRWGQRTAQAAASSNSFAQRIRPHTCEGRGTHPGCGVLVGKGGGSEPAGCRLSH